MGDFSQYKDTVAGLPSKIFKANYKKIHLNYIFHQPNFEPQKNIASALESSCCVSTRGVAKLQGSNKVQRISQN